MAPVPSGSVRPRVGPPLHPTHYECLGLEESATAQRIDQAWSDWQARHPGLPPHPESTASPQPGGHAQTALAHAVLSDPARRAVYDRWLAAEREADRLALKRQTWWRKPQTWQLGAVGLLLAGIVAGLSWLLTRT